MDETSNWVGKWITQKTWRNVNQKVFIYRGCWDFGFPMFYLFLEQWLQFKEFGNIYQIFWNVFENLTTRHVISLKIEKIKRHRPFWPLQFMTMSSLFTRSSFWYSGAPLFLEKKRVSVQCYYEDRYKLLAEFTKISAELKILFLITLLPCLSLALICM